MKGRLGELKAGFGWDGGANEDEGEDWKNGRWEENLKINGRNKDKNEN